MSFCQECPIEEKLMQCCGKYPMSGEKSILSLPGGVTLSACQHLTAGGLCSAYFRRPQGCRDFTCDAFVSYSKKILDVW